jgi:hypothetical protein
MTSSSVDDSIVRLASRSSPARSGVARDNPMIAQVGAAHQRRLRHPRRRPGRVDGLAGAAYYGRNPLPRGGPRPRDADIREES